MPFIGQWHQHSELTANAFGFPHDDLKHCAIHRVIGSIKESPPDDVTSLAIPIDATFSLLVAGWIPAQVIVHDRIKPVLQVDAFREAVRRYQDRLLRLSQGLHLANALFGGELSCYNIDIHVSELLAKMVTDVVSGRDITAKDDGGKAL